MGINVATTGASVSAFTRFRQIFFWGSFFLIFGILFFGSIIQSFQQRTPMPFINELGSRFLLATQNLASASQEIIDNGGIVVEHTGPFSAITSYLFPLSSFYASLFIIYVWLKILMFGWARSPLSSKDEWFKNFLLAIGTFTVLQMIFLVSAGAINKEINGASDVARLLATPFTAYWTFIKSLPLVFAPATDLASKYIPNKAGNLTQ